MSGFSLPVNRPMGRALVIGSAANRAQPLEVLRRIYGFDCAESDNPYAAMLELCRRKVSYNAIVLSLASLYREELPVVSAIKRRFPHLEVWLTHTDGRAAALAEAMRLGADGLLGEDGLHRVAPAPATEPATYPKLARDPESSPDPSQDDENRTEDTPAPDEPLIDEPVLTADELRALLQDQPSMPPGPHSPEGS